jgi:hypothetical protein
MAVEITFKYFYHPTTFLTTNYPPLAAPYLLLSFQHEGGKRRGPKSKAALYIFTAISYATEKA